MRRIGTDWGIVYHMPVSGFDLEIFCDSNACEGFVRSIDCNRCNGTYDDSGNLKYCRSYEYDTKYGNHASVHQLRRNLSRVSDVGNGACTECVSFGRIKKDKINKKGAKEETWGKVQEAT